MSALPTSAFRTAVRRAGGIAVAIPLVVVLAPSAPGQAYGVHTFVGSGPGIRLGSAVAGAGDVDADGFSDVLVGVPREGPGGRAFVYSGASGLPVLSFRGSASGDDFGHSVAGGTDFDGDGTPDTLIGIPRDDPGGTTDAGKVRAYSGADGGVLFTIQGALDNERLGTAVACVGDTDGDGTPDVVALAPGSGRVLVWSGTGVPLLDVTVPGVAAVSGVGDLNADGFSDLLIGIPVPSPGLARVVSGIDGVTVLRDFLGTYSAGQLGFAVAGAGDVDADGVPDVIAGDPAFDPGFSLGIGNAVAFSGATGSTLFSREGMYDFNELGYAVAGAGDVNGDGFDDVIVGGPGAGPSGYGGRALLLAGPSGALLTYFPGSPYDFLGSSVASVGDVNADGFPDFAIGSPGFSLGMILGIGTQEGRVTVHSLAGIPPGVSTFGVGCPGAGGFAPRVSACGGSPVVGNAAFGIAVSRAPGGTSSFLFFGTAPDYAGLPFGGCLAHLAGAILFVGPSLVVAGNSGASGTGYGLRQLGVPAIPALLGSSLYFQWLVFDAAGPNGLFTVSDGLIVSIV